MASLSVVVIAFNEESNLPHVINELIFVLARNWDTYEVIIVNDGSTDNTGKVAEQLSNDNKHIIVIHHPQRKGIGGALKSGYAKAGLEYSTFLPADGQIPPGEILKFWPEIERADFIISSYTLRPDAKSRLFISKVLRNMMKVMISFNLKSEGIYLFKRSILNSVDLKFDSMMLNFEFPLKAFRRGFAMGHVVIDCQPRISGKSKVANLKTILITFWDLLKLRWDLRHYPVVTQGTKHV